MIDWTAALVILTGVVAIGGAYSYVTRLIVRAELAKLDQMYLPRREASMREAEVERRLTAAGL